MHLRLTTRYDKSAANAIRIIGLIAELRTVAQCRASGVDGLVEDHQVYLLGGDLRRDLGEVEDRACEAV